MLQQPTRSLGQSHLRAALDRQVVLGIETSCDETAAAVIIREPHGCGRVLSTIVRSQWSEHAPFGGVVPEIAARAHLSCLDDIVDAALTTSGVAQTDLTLVAATAGPGLIGGLLVGLTFAKGFAAACGLPIAAVNHLEGHALTVGLTDERRPPYLLLLVSGGHTQIVRIEAIGRYQRLGSTIDDALGEAFDKTAKLLGLPAPGGPSVERMARTGRPSAIALPRPLLGRPEPNFSFAGLKTAVRRAALDRANGDLDAQTVADFCAAFQAAVCDVLADRCARAMAIAETTAGPDGAPVNCLVVAGGVAANKAIRTTLEETCRARGWDLVVPPPALCADNAVMIAWAAAERVAHGLDVGGFDSPARARWPLDDDAAPLVGSGRLGVKV